MCKSLLLAFIGVVGISAIALPDVTDGDLVEDIPARSMIAIKISLNFRPHHFKQYIKDGVELDDSHPWPVYPNFCVVIAKRTSDFDRSLEPTEYPFDTDEISFAWFRRGREVEVKIPIKGKTGVAEIDCLIASQKISIGILKQGLTSGGMELILSKPIKLE